LSAREWRAVGAAIAANTRLAAMLLAGEMPEDIETAFAAAGTTLFPKTQSELKTACSCPDWSNPCKHVAAVFYLIGEEFDRDPFLLFVVRGLPREAVRELLAPGDAAESLAAAGKPAALGKPAEKRAAAREAKDADARNGRAKSLGSRAAAKSVVRGKIPAEADSKERRSSLADPADFWGAPQTPLAPAITGSAIAAPPLDAVLLRKAGRFPFWRADVSLEDALSPLYARAAENALAWLAEHPQTDG
jgi:uncharacterized Zn finger protein